MKLNKALQVENDRLKEEITELRELDIRNFVMIWDLIQEKILLWEEGLAGLACDLQLLYSFEDAGIESGYAITKTGKLYSPGLSYHNKEGTECSI